MTWTLHNPGGSTVVNGTEVIETVWPYDGPHAADGVIEAAAAIRHLYRYLANATQRPDLLSGPELSDLLHALAEAGGPVHQLYRQLATAATTLHHAEGLHHDDDGDPHAELGRVHDQLVAAQASAEAARIALGRAAGAASHIGHDLPEEP